MRPRGLSRLSAVTGAVSLRESGEQRARPYLDGVALGWLGSADGHSRVVGGDKSMIRLHPRTISLGS